MAEVAKQAGVGLATLHRRFTRIELIEAVFTDRAAEYLQIAERALQQPPWDGFISYLEQLCEMQARDRSVSDVLTLRLPDCPAVASLRDQIYYAQLKLISRAQQDGSLRADLVPEDVILILLATGGVIAATVGTMPEAWRRVFVLITESLRAGSRQALPDAPRPEDLLAALRAPFPGRRPALGVARV
jgi:AcrR family transcriptional regulator